MESSGDADWRGTKRFIDLEGADDRGNGGKRACVDSSTHQPSLGHDASLPSGVDFQMDNSASQVAHGFSINVDDSFGTAYEASWNSTSSWLPSMTDVGSATLNSDQPIDFNYPDDSYPDSQWLPIPQDGLKQENLDRRSSRDEFAELCDDYTNQCPTDALQTSPLPDSHFLQTTSVATLTGDPQGPTDLEMRSMDLLPCAEESLSPATNVSNVMASKCQTPSTSASSPIVKLDDDKADVKMLDSGLDGGETGTDLDTMQSSIPEYDTCFGTVR